MKCKELGCTLIENEKVKCGVCATLLEPGRSWNKVIQHIKNQHKANLDDQEAKYGGGGKRALEGEGDAGGSDGKRPRLGRDEE